MKESFEKKDNSPEEISKEKVISVLARQLFSGVTLEKSIEIIDLVEEYIKKGIPIHSARFDHEKKQLVHKIYSVENGLIRYGEFTEEEHRAIMIASTIKDLKLDEDFIKEARKIYTWIIKK